MNFKKLTSGNIEHAYENFIISNNKNNDYKKERQKKRLLSNISPLKNNVNYPISKSRESISHDKEKTIKEKILPNVLKKNESKKINIEEKKSINEYTRYNQKRKKEVERKPIISSYSYNKMQINNNNIKNNNNNRNKNLKHFKSNEHGNNNINNQLSENNLNQNWKKNLIKNTEKKPIYELYNQNSLNNNNNNTINNIYKVTNNLYDEKNLNKNKNNYSNKITYKCIYNNHTFTESKNLPNYNDLSQNSSNINLDNKISQDNLRNRDLNDIRYNNPTFENKYKTKNINFPNLNVNSTNNVHNLHDGNYELNNTDNHNNRNVHNNISSFSKFLSNSSSQITSHDFHKNTPYNFYSLKKPMKNDEETNPQNLTINLTNIDKNNTESISTNTKGLSTIKYMDNTSKASNISVYNDNKNISSKKYINFMKEYKDNNIMKKYNLSLNSDYNQPSENHNKYFDLTMIIPSNNQKNKLYINNNNSYINENINKTNNYFYINKNNKFKEKSPEINNNNDVYNNKSNHIYINNPSSIIVPTRNDNEKKNDISSFNQNKTLDDIYNNKESKIKYEHEKKIKEITVDLSPRQKSFSNNKAYNITPNFHNKNKIYENQIDKYNINNIKPKPKSIIESCIITFDKPNKKSNNNSYDKQIKLINSNDDINYNKIKYIKKKVSINNDIPIPNNNKYPENSGTNIKNDNNNNIFVYNKNRSVQKLYQKPVNKTLSNSYGNLLFKKNENTNEEFGTSSPNQNDNKKLKNDDDLKSNIYNRSPLLTNYNYKINDNSEKEQIISPISEKYNKLSYNEIINNNINNIYYINNKLNKFKINNNFSYNNSPSNKNELITEQNNDNNKIKNIYIKKTKAYSELNNNIINKKDTPDKINPISNRSDAIKVENDLPKDDKDKKTENDKKQLNKITLLEVYDLHKKDKISKLNIKSFNSKKKEMRQKPKLSYMFFQKYYELYLIQPKKEKMYITKFVKKPSKKPIISISYISKVKYDYVFKIPISSYEYYTKKIVPDSIILPKIGIEYTSKTLIKNKKEFKNKIINEKDKLLNNNNILQEKKTKYRKYQKRPIKNRIILIKKTSKNQNDNNNNNDNHKNKNNEYKSRIILIKDNNKKDKRISKEKKEDLNKDYYKHNNLNNNDKNNNNIEKITKNTIENNKNEIKDNKVIIKSKLINIIEEEKLKDNKKIDNEKNLISNNENISFNINMNNQKIIIDSKNNDYKNPSKLILFDKAINNLKLNSQSTKTNFNEVLDQLSFNRNIIKSTLINVNLINNNYNYSINNKDNSLLSKISNNNINKELDNNINNKKNIFKIKVIIKGIKKSIKKGCKHDFLKNYKHNNNLKISDILKEPLRSEKDMERENKIDLIIKEDLENFIIFYKKENNKNNIMKYNYSIIEQLIIKIKLDIVDIINGCLNVCSDLIYTKKYFIIIIEYIKNIIQHYKCNYLTNINFNNIHIKVLKLFLSVNDIKIYDNIKYKILGSILYISINNSLFFINDFNIFKQANVQIKDKIKKIINNCDNSKSFLSKIEI